ncbi:hypothetical protein M2272_005952 [Mycobacterium frederiksbergense]|uniref:Uncharacterized protein n=1 Tax=Mycolicibacterium frederiksbergense TaxID=117567 RepID=A0ABT6L8K5_9MYCO|nr:hypothetical protein [Mycolicibacterium frederiksbergense]MDH6199283.1 hypothetical protein [Mycolicibacterium frederiksbergense]
MNGWRTRGPYAPLAARAGLRPDQIAALSAGARPADLSEDELVAADVAAALTCAGPVPGPLYAPQARCGRAGPRITAASPT